MLNQAGCWCNRCVWYKVGLHSAHKQLQLLARVHLCWLLFNWAVLTSAISCRDRVTFSCLCKSATGFCIPPRLSLGIGQARESKGSRQVDGKQTFWCVHYELA